MPSLVTSAKVPTSATLDITVFEDTNGDGTADNRETVSVPNGSSTAELSTVTNDSANGHWLYIHAVNDHSQNGVHLDYATLEFVVQVNWWDGSQWVKKPLKRWDGSQWVKVQKFKHWDGSNWVDVQ